MGRRPKLPVLPLDVGFFDDERIIAAGDGPAALYLAMCLKAKLLGSDGRLWEGQIARLNRTQWRVELKTLDSLALVAPDAPEWWFITGWFKHNESNADAEARLEADRYRKQLPDSVRRKVYDRDDWRCVQCGTSDDLSIDHIIPLSRGGTHAEENLRTLCRPCNSAKGDRV